MARKDKKDFFWLSYSDLMTSLFFVMLALFILVYSMQNSVISNLQAAEEEQNKAMGELRAAKEELEKIKEIAAATKALEDGGLYEYNEKCKRFELKQEILFEVNSAVIPQGDVKTLVSAGKQIQRLTKRFKVSTFTKSVPANCAKRVPVSLGLKLVIFDGIEVLDAV